MEKYDNLGMVGEGSYGMVMKCKHKETGQVVAIKKFLESEDDKMVKKIAMREVRMLRKLRHENLVNLIEVFRRRKRLYLVFEFVDHTVLDDLEKYPNGLSEMTVRKILWQVLRGVEFCHSHNIIHRDIKPENILNSRGGVIKICDFGFARSLAAHGEIYTDYVATRWYRAPELLVGDTKYGRAIDIWAIGCLIGEMMIGDPLFPGKSDIDQIYRVTRCLGNLSPRHREIFQRNPLFAGMRLPEVKEVEPLEKKFPRFSSEIIDVMKQCLRLDPNDRPSSSSLLRHEFFRKDNFEEKVIPEIRARIQKEHQQNQMVRKNLAEKQQKQQELAEEKRKKKKEQQNTSGSKDQPVATPPNKPLATPPNKSLPTPPNNTTGKPQNLINKDSPRNAMDSKNIPIKKETNVDPPRKESLAALKPQQSKTPPSDEIRKKKESEKDRKLPATIKQDNTVVTGPAKPQQSKDDFSSPRTLIPKMTNDSLTRSSQDSLKNLLQDSSKSPKNTSPVKDKSPREGGIPDLNHKEDKKHVTIAKDNVGTPKKNLTNKTPPLSKSPTLVKEPKQSILKNPQTGARASKENLTFEDLIPKGSNKGSQDKRSNMKPDQDAYLTSSGPLTKSISDTTVFRDKKGVKNDKHSTSTPPTPSDLTLQVKQTKTQNEKSPKEAKQQKLQKDSNADKKDRPMSSKQGGGYKIPPIQSQGPPIQSTRTGHLEMESSVDAVKQFPSQGIKVLDKAKKAGTNKEFSPQTSYEKSMYGSTVSNFEKMMLSMSGATSISHPAIKKNNPTSIGQTGGTSSSPYTQSQSPYSQQFGHHFQREDKPSGSNLPLWSTPGQSYFEKHQMHRMDGRGSDADKKPHRTSDDKTTSHHRHHHHHKHEEKINDERKLSKSHDEKVAIAYGRDAKRTKLPDLMGRGMGVAGGMSTSRTDEFPGLKQTGAEYQKRKSKTQKPSLMPIPNYDSTSQKQYNGASPNENSVYPESNLPSVRRKL
ncbi:uncharacterized protein LOC120347737 isoform X1 [Styela clava]